MVAMVDSHTPPPARAAPTTPGQGGPPGRGCPSSGAVEGWHDAPARERPMPRSQGRHDAPAQVRRRAAAHARQESAALPTESRRTGIFSVLGALKGRRFNPHELLCKEVACWVPHKSAADRAGQVPASPRHSRPWMATSVVTSTDGCIPPPEDSTTYGYRPCRLPLIGASGELASARTPFRTTTLPGGLE